MRGYYPVWAGADNPAAGRYPRTVCAAALMPVKRARALLLCQCIILCSSLLHPGKAAGEQAAPLRSITVVSDDNYPPYVLRDAEGAIRGILVDQWRLWEKRTGIAVTLVAMDWGKAQRFMAEGKADVIDTIFFTEERARLYDFTRPWATIEVPVFFHRNISGISDARSLLGFTVGVKEGDAAIGYLARNGITTIQEFASYEAIARAALPPGSPARERVKDIDVASRRAAELCRQMLAYSGRGSFSVETMDMSRLVRGMTNMLEVSVSKKAALHADLPEGLPSISGDATQIRQILMNLIINASEAIGDGQGEIRVRTGVMACSEEYLTEGAQGETPPAGRYVFLDVEDTGCGMDRATRARIFDPFFSTKFTGRGLGLAAVLGIVRGHGGAIRVTSEPGKGTTFRVLFPAAENAAAPVNPDREASPWKGSGTVLLVDDEPAVRNVAKAMLEAIGFSVLLASDGREAVDAFRNRADEIACIILDLTTPRMGGEEAFVELRRIRPGARIAISTGYSEEDAIMRFAGERPPAYIQKPYRLAELSKVLRELLSAVPPVKEPPDFR